MKIKSKPTEPEIIESLKRSGYLLESEVSKFMASQGYFVEANQVIKDLTTGKSREIDLTAEYYDFDAEPSEHKIATKIRFVFEIKNNALPVVLLTDYHYSPNLDLFESLKVIRTGKTPLGDLSLTFFDFFVPSSKEAGRMFTQYCSFQRKKDKEEELMATHPEEIYSGLSKITQFCEEEIEPWNEESEAPSGSDVYDRHDYERYFVYLPVLLIKDDLFELDIDEQNTPTLRAVPYSRFLLNYHFKEMPKTALVHFVTKNGLPDFLQEMRTIEKKIETLMLEAIRQHSKVSDK